MINEERIILMTKLAAYEKGEGRQSMAIGKYFMGDYISLHLLRTVLSGTLAYLLAVGIYVLYFYEDLMANLYSLDFAGLARNVVVYYIVFLVVYGVITYVFFTLRFLKAKKSIKRYYHNLKKLNSMYHQQPSAVEEQAEVPVRRRK